VRLAGTATRSKLAADVSPEYGVQVEADTNTTAAAVCSP
jgi:hypothetical protein